jgi:hypothetical protein
MVVFIDVVNLTKNLEKLCYTDTEGTGDATGASLGHTIIRFFLNFLDSFLKTDMLKLHDW